MIDLKQMRDILNRNCKPAKNSIFSFEIDIKKLEEDLNNNSDLHVIATTCNNNILGSKIPSVNDIPILLEFITQKGQLEEIMSGQQEIIILTLYSDKDGSYVVRDKGKEIPTDELFKKLNNIATYNSEDLDLKLICRLVSTLPSYRVLITKKFVPKKDKLIYSIRIRYNKAALDYVVGSGEDTEEAVVVNPPESLTVIKPVVSIKSGGSTTIEGYTTDTPDIQN